MAVFVFLDDIKAFSLVFQGRLDSPKILDHEARFFFFGASFHTSNGLIVGRLLEG